MKSIGNKVSPMLMPAKSQTPALKPYTCTSLANDANAFDFEFIEPTSAGLFGGKDKMKRLVSAH